MVRRDKRLVLLARVALALASLVAFLFLTAFSIFTGEDSKVKEANNAVSSGDFDKAAKLYDEAEADYGHSAVLEYNRGVMLYKKGEYDKARQKFLSAIGESDENFKADNYYNLGNTYMKLNGLDAAIMYYRKALQANPNHESARKNLEIALHKKIEEEKKKKEQEKQDQQKQDNQQQQQESQQEEQKDQQQDNQQQQDQAQNENKEEQNQSQNDKQEEQKAQEENEKQNKEQEQQKNMAAQNAQENKDKEKPEEEKNVSEQGEQLLNSLQREEDYLQRQMFMDKRTDKNNQQQGYDW